MLFASQASFIQITEEKWGFRGLNPSLAYQRHGGKTDMQWIICPLFNQQFRSEAETWGQNVMLNAKVRIILSESWHITGFLDCLWAVLGTNEWFITKRSRSHSTLVAASHIWHTDDALVSCKIIRLLKFPFPYAFVKLAENHSLHTFIWSACLPLCNRWAD